MRTLPPPPTAAPLTPSEMDRLAPAPRIRVGLSARTEALRLTSSRPFRVSGSRRLIETQDVLIEPARSSVLEGAVFRLQLGSFPTQEVALALQASTREELDDEIVLRREPGSGRFAVRVGGFTTESAARARAAELTALGFEGVAVTREPSRVARPRAVVLRTSGQPAIETSGLTLYAVPASTNAFVEVDGRPYRGYLEVFVNASNLFTVVNVVNLEDYLKGVVPAELSPAVFPEKEAIKAQALAARTYVQKRRGQFAAEGYDICATPACQVYQGVAAEQPMASEAVLETSGEVLTYNGALVDALYTSTCGGRTENAENVFVNPEPYLVSRACFLESRLAVMSSSNPRPLSLEAAMLERLGIAPAKNEGPATAASVRLWVERAISHIGQSPCFGAREAGPFDVVALSELLAGGLCWERRLPFLISELDASRLAMDAGLSNPERRHLAYAIQRDLIRPGAQGIARGTPLSHATILGTLYRLVSQIGETPLRRGTIESVDGARIRLTDDGLGEEDNVVATALARQRYLYRQSGETVYYMERVSLLAGDQVLFHLDDSGIDVLVVLSGGASFDRSSRFSHWVVRKTKEDLSRDVNMRHRVGTVQELRPKRYGRSGRIVELEIIGTAGSAVVEGLAVRRTLGIRENLFFLDAQRSKESGAESWVFTGRGWGHGVGMCQVGAYGMASAGYSYRQILSHYYPGTRIARTGENSPSADVDKGQSTP